MEALPERSDRLVFSRHPKYLFQLAIQDITRGQQFLEPLEDNAPLLYWCFCDKEIESYCGDLCTESITLSLKERGLLLRHECRAAMG